MCLRTNWIIPRIALRPIKCYKVVVKITRRKFFTPAVGYKLKKYNKEKLSPLISKKGKVYREVTKGYFHAYTDIEYADPEGFLNKSCIVECIIPRFSLYFIDVYNMEICSKRLICKL